jgi:hypothetical protein
MVHSPSPTDLLQPPASSLQLGAVRRNNKTARLPQSAVPVIHCVLSNISRLQPHTAWCVATVVGKLMDWTLDSGLWTVVSLIIYLL